MVYKLKNLKIDDIQIINQGGNGKFNFINFGLGSSKEYLSIQIPWNKSFGIKDYKNNKKYTQTFIIDDKETINQLKQLEDKLKELAKKEIINFDEKNFYSFLKDGLEDTKLFTIKCATDNNNLEASIMNEKKEKLRTDFKSVEQLTLNRKAKSIFTIRWLWYDKNQSGINIQLQETMLKDFDKIIKEKECCLISDSD